MARFERVENVLDDHIRQGVLATFPGRTWDRWYRYGSGKLATKHPTDIPTSCRLALWVIAQKVRPQEGFWDLEYFHGSGLHFMPLGTSLGSHIDAQRLEQPAWVRTGSLVYFPEQGDGGELVVDGTTIPAEENVAVLFDGQQEHSVNETYRDRRTLSLFSYIVDADANGTTTATFREGE